MSLTNKMQIHANQNLNNEKFKLDTVNIHVITDFTSREQLQIGNRCAKSINMD